MSSFSSKYIMFVLKNTEELSFITLKGDAKFEEKLTFSKWLEKFDKFSPEHSKSQNWDFKCMRLKFREELYVMSMKNDGKFGEGIELSFQIWHEKFDEFWPEYSKVSKICVLMGSFWPKYIMPELKKYIGVMFVSNYDWCKILRKSDLNFQKWHEDLRNLENIYKL